MNLYALLIGLGASLSVLEVVKSAPHGQTQRCVDAALLSLLAALVGARLAYSCLHGSYYANHPIEIFQVWQGGLSAPGAIAGALLADVALARGSKIPFLKLADILAPMLAPLGASVWLGCWTAGCAYGLPSVPGSWWGLNALDETGAVRLRFPLQLITAFCLVAFLGQIEFRKMPFKAPGQKASLEWLGINFSYLAATFLMGSPAPYWAGLRMESWMAILLSLLNLAFCGFVFRLIPTKTRGVL